VSVSFKDALGQRDLFLLTLDALRWDVAENTLARGEAPNLAALIGGAFERRQTCATFTLPAHQAFFAGFLPTPPGPGPHPRPIALRFPGSKSISPHTLTLEGACIPSALGRAGYHTICIGGTSFFNPDSPLGAALPRAFDEAHWSREMGVASPRASRLQLALAASRLREIPSERRVFLFINLSATHPPTRIFLKGAKEESVATQAAALRELDRHLPVLFDAMRARGGAVGIVCSDHGTCFGDDGHVGHRVAHEAVWNVPYAEVSVASEVSP
jgi:arylsulfatase A-like enzyme